MSNFSFLHNECDRKVGIQCKDLLDSPRLRNASLFRSNFYFNFIELLFCMFSLFASVARYFMPESL